MAKAAVTLWTAVATAAMVVVATTREEIKPSLECSCRSSQRAEDRFDLNCQNIGNGEVIGGANGMRVEESLLSCAQGQRGGGAGAGAGDWLLADVPGWGVYRLSRRLLGWKDAAAACEAVREQLVALDGGEAEVHALLSAFAPHTPNRKELLWVGIRYLPDVKEFYTVRGQKMSQLSWAAQQPSIKDGENCVKLEVYGKIHSTHTCNDKRRFFCKG